MIETTENSVCKISLLLGGTAGLFLFLLGYRHPGSGLALGTMTSILNLRLLGRTVRKITQNNPRSSQAVFFGHYLFRYFLSGLMLFMCIQKSLAMFWSAAAGLFMVRIAIYLYVWHQNKRQVKIYTSLR